MGTQKNKNKSNKETSVEVVSTESVSVEDTEVVVHEPETIMIEKEDENTWDKTIIELKNEQQIIKEASKRQDKLLIELERIRNKEVKLHKKRTKGNKGNGKHKDPSGFNKKTEVPQSIRDLFNIDPSILMARTEVTKQLYEYIRNNNLQDPQDKRIIHPDKKLKNLFTLEDHEDLSFSSFQTHMKKLYPKKEEISKPNLVVV